MSTSVITPRARAQLITGVDISLMFGYGHVWLRDTHM